MLLFSFQPNYDYKQIAEYINSSTVMHIIVTEKSMLQSNPHKNVLCYIVASYVTWSDIEEHV